MHLLRSINPLIYRRSKVIGIFNNISTAVMYTVEQYPVKLDKNNVINILLNIAEKQFISPLTNAERTSLLKILDDEVTNWNYQRD
jgi:hypothetical protein